MANFGHMFSAHCYPKLTVLAICEKAIPMKSSRPKPFHWRLWLPDGVECFSPLICHSRCMHARPFGIECHLTTIISMHQVLHYVNQVLLAHKLQPKLVRAPHMCFAAAASPVCTLATAVQEVCDMQSLVCYSSPVHTVVPSVLGSASTDRMMVRTGLL